MRRRSQQREEEELPSLPWRSLNRPLALQLKRSMSCREEARLMLAGPSRGRGWACAPEGGGSSQGGCGAGGSGGPGPSLAREPRLLGAISARVSLASGSAAPQGPPAGEGGPPGAMGAGSSGAPGGSTSTASGSSWGRGCLAVPIRLSAACRKRRNRRRPGRHGDEEEELHPEEDSGHALIQV